MSKNQQVKPPRKQFKPHGNHEKINILFQELVTVYSKRCKLINLSPETIAGYETSCKYFMQWFNDNYEEELYCHDVTQDLINDYVFSLITKHKPQTVNSYQFKISPVIKYGMENKYILDNIRFSHCVEQQHFKDIYTQDEISKLLEKPKSDSFSQYRDWVIINTLLAKGIRSRELRELIVSDVDLSNNLLNLSHTKNRQIRIIPIPSALHKVFSEYLITRNGANSEPLFCNIYGEQLNRTTLQLSIVKYCNKRGVEKTSLHLFRHTFITLSVRNGMSPLLLQRITGHKDLKTLNNYYQCDVTDLVNVVDNFNPLQTFKNKEKKDFKMKK